MQSKPQMQRKFETCNEANRKGNTYKYTCDAGNNICYTADNLLDIWNISKMSVRYNAVTCTVLDDKLNKASGWPPSADLKDDFAASRKYLAHYRNCDKLYNLEGKTEGNSFCFNKTYPGECYLFNKSDFPKFYNTVEMNTYDYECNFDSVAKKP